MKRIISALTAFLIMGAFTFIASANTPSEDNEWIYGVWSDGTAVIGSGAPAVSKHGGNVEIPVEIDGYTVTEIGARCFTEEAGLFTVFIPYTVISVGDYAFERCYGLSRVTMENGAEVIGNYAFSECYGLNNLVLSDKIVSIGDGAFKNCCALTEIYVPYGIDYIGKEAFSGCSALSEIILPDTLTELGDNAFEFCKPSFMIYYAGTVEQWNEIKKDESDFDDIAVTFMQTELPDYQPYNESNGFLYKIKSDNTVSLIEYTGAENNVAIPVEIEGYPVSVIADGCFENRYDIISVEIPDTVSEIGDNAFRCCRYLETVSFGEGISLIGNEAFYGCECIKSITLPQTLSYIGKGAFQSCTGLTEIVIPKSVETIENYAFNSCRKLETVYYGGDEREWRSGHIGNGNSAIKNARFVYNYDPATYKPAGPHIAIFLCCIAAVIPLVVVMALLLRRKKCCTGCGYEIEDNSKFCGGCGREL